MYLPSAPSNEQKTLFVDSGKNKFYLWSSLSTLSLLIGAFLFVSNYSFIIPYTLFCIINLTYLFCAYIVGFASREFNYKKHDALIAKHLDKSTNQEIAIWLPVCGEPLELMRNTWKYVIKLIQAHEGKINVYVLDDGHSKEVENMAKELNFNYVDRGTNELKKAGNLRNIFSKTTEPYFIILDTDFAPRSDFIINLMPYFYEDGRIGISQSPQFFEVTNNMTKVQKAASAVQELFYRLIQVNRDSFHGAICIGSNAIYSRKHLERYGGTADIGYSEDVRTSYRLSKDGGVVKYIPINLAMGTCPENWKSFFTQYYRWSMGSLDLMLSKEFWQKGLSIMQRICYLTGMGYYLSTGLSVIFISLPSIYLLIFHPEYMFWYNLIFSIPSLIMSILFMKHWSILPYTIDVLRVRQISAYAHLFAFKDLLMKTTEAWIVTGAKNNSKKYDTFVVFFTTMTLAIPIIIISLVSVRIFEGYNPINFALLLLITAFNAYINIPIIDDL